MQVPIQFDSNVRTSRLDLDAGMHTWIKLDVDSIEICKHTFASNLKSKSLLYSEETLGPSSTGATQLQCNCLRTVGWELRCTFFVHWRNSPATVNAKVLYFLSLLQNCCVLVPKTTASKKAGILGSSFHSWKSSTVKPGNLKKTKKSSKGFTGCPGHCLRSWLATCSYIDMNAFPLPPPVSCKKPDLGLP